MGISILNKIDEYSLQAIDAFQEKMASDFTGCSARHIIRSRLVFFETKIKPWCDSEAEYLSTIGSVLDKAGVSLSSGNIKKYLSECAKEIGFDRKSLRIDRRKAKIKISGDL